MQRGLILFFVLFLLIVNVSAVCEKNQIDINSASLEKLDEIIWVGEITAQKIIDARPFESVDDLMKVSGIKEAKLEDIKEQGLACIEDSEELEENYQNNSETEYEKDYEGPEEIVSSAEENSEPIEREVISLGTKNIKTEINKEVDNKKNYAWLYLVSFCFFLGLMYLIKGKFNRKNEFR